MFFEFQAENVLISLLNFRPFSASVSYKLVPYEKKVYNYGKASFSRAERKIFSFSYIFFFFFILVSFFVLSIVSVSLSVCVCIGSVKETLIFFSKNRV